MSDKKALQTVDASQFSWACRLNDVWSDVLHDVAGLHPNLRAEFERKIEGLLAQRDIQSPLGWVLLGEGGSGKTHLLNAFRRMAVERGAYFVLLDLTDVRTFWESALQGYIDSLQEECVAGIPQCQLVLQRLVTEKLGIKSWEKLQGRLRVDEEVDEATNELIQELWKKDRKIQPCQQDVIRCLAYLNSGSFQFYNLGVTWLQGQELDVDSRQRHGFQRPVEDPIVIASALSWVMSQTAPTVLALDQLDATVMQLVANSAGEPATDEAMAETLLLEIGRGLLSLRDKLGRTWTILSCLEQTWEQLRDSQLKTAVDRYEEPPRVLSRMSDEEVISSLIAQRIGAAAKKVGFQPSYPTWPIHPEAIAKMVGETPRDVLKICERHRRDCLERCRVDELKHFEKPSTIPSSVEEAELQRLDELYKKRQSEVDLTEIFAEEAEDKFFAPLLDMAARLAIEENFSSLPAGIDTQLDASLPSGRIRPLHVRLRVIFENEGEREQHYSVRVLQKTNHRAYLARLNAAIVASGIDARLPFRQLRIIRTTPIPTGFFTDRLNRKFKKLGGCFICPDEDEVKKLVALRVLQGGGYEMFNEWIHDRRPISEIGFVRAAMPCLQIWGEKRFNELQIGDYSPELPSQIDQDESEVEGQVSLGRAVLGKELQHSISIPAEALNEHGVILAGVKTGRSALLKRITEECALLGVPSLFIDLRGRADLGEPWPAPPESWEIEDIRKAAQYHQMVSVKTWAPFLEGAPDLPREVNGTKILVSELLQKPKSDQIPISVVNAIGLEADADRQKFLIELFESAISWLKSGGGRSRGALQGFIVIDELDSCLATANCSKVFRELLKVAREAGVGILCSFEDAAQIGGDVLELFQTQFFGRAHAPGTISAIQRVLQQCGGESSEIARLSRGEFFVHHPEISKGIPSKVYSPICLSRHPQEALAANEVRKRIQRD
mgnify:CR=1 FL=1|tara:strand:+ start:2705 stop:5554 length:2850 start_codon:yes stop_codon:yes gene_type:complete